jgi:hypothetical protein
MGKRHLVQLVDDIDGSEAVKTVGFAINNHHYELDLSQANLDTFERAVSRYVSVARTSSPADHRKWVSLATDSGSEPTPEPEPVPAPSPAKIAEPVFDGSVQDMRLWAERKHMVIRPRARVPREIEHAYSAAAERDQRVRGG